MAQAPIKPSKIEGVQQNFGTAIRLCHGKKLLSHRMCNKSFWWVFFSVSILLAGGDGWSADKQWHTSADRHAGRLCHLHDTLGGRAHAGPNDKHLHFTEHWSRVQFAQHFIGPWITARTFALVHWDSMGILDAARTHIVSHRNCHIVLGEILRFEQRGRMVGVHRIATGFGYIFGICHTFLSIANDA